MADVTNMAICAVIGVLIGFFLARLTKSGDKQQSDLKSELDKANTEREQYRQELIDHFAESAELLENISRDYNKLCQQMAKTSTELLPNLPEQDNPFTHRLTHQPEQAAADTVEQQEQPKDYSGTSSGLLNGEEEAPIKQEEEKKETVEKTEKTEKAEKPEKVE